MVSELKSLDCFIENDLDRAHHLFGVALPKHVNIEALKAELSNQNIFVSFRGNYIRLSCYLFNTSEDFNTLLNCMKPFLLAK
jgi:selenocysteine lyase/cysteine desulfurase